MAEYIKRGIAIAKLTELEVTRLIAIMHDAKRVLADMPTADVAPVVHGKWIRIGGRGNRASIFECLVCKKCEPHISNYCPHCGAKMAGGVDDG